MYISLCVFCVFFFQAEDGIRDKLVTGVQTCALPICSRSRPTAARSCWRCVDRTTRSEEHTSELQSLAYLVCRLLLEKKKKQYTNTTAQYERSGRCVVSETRTHS